MPKIHSLQHNSEFTPGERQRALDNTRAELQDVIALVRSLDLPSTAITDVISMYRSKCGEISEAKYAAERERRNAVVKEIRVRRLGNTPSEMKGKSLYQMRMEDGLDCLDYEDLQAINDAEKT